jgi:hypothetical protein
MFIGMVVIGKDIKQFDVLNKSFWISHTDLISDIEAIMEEPMYLKELY